MVASKLKSDNKTIKTKNRVKNITLKRSRKKSGGNLVNRIIDKIPFELHVPSYQYCGPGTKLEHRLARGDPGKNPLDAACKIHDIAYDQYKDTTERNKADKILQNEAVKRVFSKDATLGERAIALGVAAAMKVKRTISGKGMSKKKKRMKRKKQRISFAHLVKHAKVAIKEFKPDNLHSAVNVALASTRKVKKGKNIIEPRTIKLPSIKGGVLPLVPIFAGLGALGSIVGSAAGVASAINNFRKGQKELSENKRHNETMEAIALGQKSGGGYYLHRPKAGRGYYLKRFAKNH